MIFPTFSPYAVFIFDSFPNFSGEFRLRYMV